MPGGLVLVAVMFGDPVGTGIDAFGSGFHGNAIFDGTNPDA